MKADAWHYELVGSQMGMAVMEHLTPRMVITHSPPLASRLPPPCSQGERENHQNGGLRRRENIHRVGQEGGPSQQVIGGPIQINTNEYSREKSSGAFSSSSPFPCFD